MWSDSANIRSNICVCLLLLWFFLSSSLPPAFPASRLSSHQPVSSSSLPSHTLTARLLHLSVPSLNSIFLASALGVLDFYVDLALFPCAEGSTHAVLSVCLQPTTLRLPAPSICLSSAAICSTQLLSGPPSRALSYIILALLLLEYSVSVHHGHYNKKKKNHLKQINNPQKLVFKNT